AGLFVVVGRHAEMRADAVTVTLVAAIRRVRTGELEDSEARRDVHELLRVAAVVNTGAHAVRRVGVGAPLVRREGREVAGAARGNDTRVRERVVVRTHAQFAEAAGEIDPGFVDLIASVIFAFQLDTRTD